MEAFLFFIDENVTKKILAEKEKKRSDEITTEDGHHVLLYPLNREGGGTKPEKQTKKYPH